MSGMGKRWVAAMGDKAWSPGMRAVTPYGFTRLRDTDSLVNLTGWLPDTTDGETLAAMMAIVRGLSDSIAYLVWMGRDPGPVLTWLVVDRDGHTLGEGPTEGAALVAAAEAWRART